MNQVATVDQQPPKQVPMSIKDYLNQPKIKERLAQALGNKANLDEFLSNVLIDIGKSEELSICTFDSILQCAIDAANFGLIPNKQLGHAYLIPYKNWKTKLTECQLQFGWKGYVKKMAEKGMSVEVELVTKQEIDSGRFEEMRGSNSYIIHRPLRTGVRVAENIVLGYAIGKRDGFKDIIVVMTLDEILAVAESEVFDKDLRQKVRKLKGVWANGERVTDFGEMCKKTLIRRLAKNCEIDVVQRMNALEGETVQQIKDVTPKQNIELNNHFMGSGSAERIEHKPQLDTLLKQANRQEPQSTAKNSLTAELSGNSEQLTEPPLPLGLPNDEAVARAEMLITDMAGHKLPEKQKMLEEMGGSNLINQLDQVRPALKERLINTMMGA